MYSIPEDPFRTLDAILPVAEQRVIVKAALLAHDGRKDEAEVVRFAARYHNLKEV